MSEQVNKMSERTEDEIRAAVFKLRTEKRMTLRQIADELGIALGRVGEMLKGVSATGEVVELLAEKKQTQTVRHVISDECEGKLYFISIGEGVSDVNKWIEENLLPWYAAKSKLEWKTQTKFTPSEFLIMFDLLMLDTIQLRQLKAQLGANQQAVAPTVQTPNKVGVKPQ